MQMDTMVEEQNSDLTPKNESTTGRVEQTSYPEPETGVENFKPPELQAHSDDIAQDHASPNSDSAELQDISENVETKDLRTPEQKTISRASKKDTQSPDEEKNYNAISQESVTVSTTDESQTELFNPDETPALDQNQSKSGEEPTKS